MSKLNKTNKAQKAAKITGKELSPIHSHLIMAERKDYLHSEIDKLSQKIQELREKKKLLEDELYLGS
jgi:hypothetical protein